MPLLPPQPPAFDVCVRGAGIVGRTLALLLAQQRLSVGLVPHAPQVQPALGADSDLRAYALNAASQAVLRQVRCWPDAQAVTPVRAMNIRGDAGGRLTLQADLIHGADLACIVDAAAIERTLASAINFQPNITVLTDTAAPHALTIVCEGRESATRAAFGIEMDSHPYNQTAIAARVQCAVPHRGQAWQGFSGGEVLALLPRGGTEGGTEGGTQDSHSMALVWSLNAERAARLLGASADDFNAELTQVVMALGGDAATLGPVLLHSERAAWPLFHAQAKRWVGHTAQGQAWALAGDAAHTVHPLAGQGLNLGLADVQALADVLGQRQAWRGVDDMAVLRRYERARRAALAPVATVLDGLQRLFAQPDARLQALRNAGLRNFDRLSSLKAWVARQANGAHPGVASAAPQAGNQR